MPDKNKVDPGVSIDSKKAPSIELPSPIHPSNTPKYAGLRLLNDRMNPVIRQHPFTIRLLMVIAFLISFFVLLLGIFFFLLQPRDESAQQKRITITPGASVTAVSSYLQDEGIIKNAQAFQLYIQIKGRQSNLQAGTYVLSPAQSVGEIVNDLTEGNVEAFRVTIYPGKTLKELAVDLEGYGFEKEAIALAFTGSYDHPLLASRPEGASLEGYIFPDTYELQGAGSVEELLNKSFDRFYDLLVSNKVPDGFAKQKLSLHQGITLSSIIQKEVGNPDDQRQVAQVFLKRLSMNMELGSDVTFIYAAQQLGVAPAVNLESPYNTRIKKGLPPGPIANFNLSAAQAVIQPKSGDFLYFVAGDGKFQDNTYFANTLEEHQENTRKYCTELCR